MPRSIAILLAIVAAVVLIGGGSWFKFSQDSGFTQAGFVYQGKICKTRYACCQSWNFGKTECKRWSYCYKDCAAK